MRVLIIYPHGFRDNVMLTGVLKLYKQLHPNHTIYLMVRQSALMPLWTGDPKVEFCLWREIPELPFSNPIAYYLWAKPRWVNRYIIQDDNLRRFYDKIVIPRIERWPDRFCERFNPEGALHRTTRIACDIFGVRYGSDEAVKLGIGRNPIHYDVGLRPRAPLDAPQGRYLVLQPFSQMNRQRATFVGELRRAEALMSRFPNAIIVGSWEHRQIYPFVRAYPINELFYVLSRASAFVGLNSGFAHLAAAARCPRVTVITDSRSAMCYRPVSRGEVNLRAFKDFQRDDDQDFESSDVPEFIGEPALVCK